MPLANANLIQRVLLLLETLTHEDSLPIIACLQENNGASFLELLVQTGLESRTLEMQLDLLCDHTLVIRQSNIIETSYRLNLDLYGKLARVAEKLGKVNRNISNDR